MDPIVISDDSDDDVTCLGEVPAQKSAIELLAEYDDDVAGEPTAATAHDDQSTSLEDSLAVIPVEGLATTPDSARRALLRTPRKTPKPLIRKLYQLKAKGTGYDEEREKQDPTNVTPRTAIRQARLMDNKEQRRLAGSPVSPAFRLPTHFAARSKSRQKAIAQRTPQGRRSSSDGYKEIRQLLQVVRGTDDDSVADIILQSVDEICKEKQAEHSTADHDDFDLESPRSRALSFSPEPLDHRRSNIDIEHDADYNDELLNDEEAYGGGDWMGNDIGDDDDVTLDDDDDVILDDGDQRNVTDDDADLSPVRAPISPVRDRVIVSPHLVRLNRILPALPRVLAPLNVPQTHPANTVQVPPRVAKPALYGSIEEFCQEYCEHWDNMSPDVQAEIELSVKLACRGVLRATNRARHALKRKSATLTLLDLSVAVGRTFLPVDEGGRTEAPRVDLFADATHGLTRNAWLALTSGLPGFGSRFGKIVHTACNVYLSCYMEYRNQQATRISFEKHELVPSDTTQTAATDFSRYVWGLKHRRADTE